MNIYWQTQRNIKHRTDSLTECINQSIFMFHINSCQNFTFCSIGNGQNGEHVTSGLGGFSESLTAVWKMFSTLWGFSLALKMRKLKKKIFPCLAKPAFSVPNHVEIINKFADIAESIFWIKFRFSSVVFTSLKDDFCLQSSYQTSCQTLFQPEISAL